MKQRLFFMIVVAMLQGFAAPAFPQTPGNPDNPLAKPGTPPVHGTLPGGNQPIVHGNLPGDDNGPIVHGNLPGDDGGPIVHGNLPGDDGGPIVHGNLPGDDGSPIVHGALPGDTAPGTPGGTLPGGATPPAAAAPSPAAVATPAAAAPDTSQVCTTFQERMTQMDKARPAGQKGILTDIYDYITHIVDGATKKLYSAFIDSSAYQNAVYGAMSLMFIIFGVGFMIGAIQPSFGQVLVRLIKFGIIVTLISPGGWEFFSSNMVAFFNDGTDSLVKGVMQIGLAPGSTIPADASPFYQLDGLADFILHPDTIIAILGASFGSGPFGAAMSGLMLAAFWTFVTLLIHALRIYAVSYVARSLLLGLAPVFFVFLLFEKTKQLFMQWVNGLVALSLQPILLFTFLSFFLVLIQSATKDMLNTELCWSEYSAGEGSTNKVAFWKFKDPKTNNVITSEMKWDGWFECTITGKSDCPEFPLNIVDVLTFLILVYLASRFSKIIERVANELSNTFIALDAGGRLDQFMKESGMNSSGNSGGGGGIFGGGNRNPAVGTQPRPGASGAPSSPSPTTPRPATGNTPPAGGGRPGPSGGGTTTPPPPAPSNSTPPPNSAGGKPRT